jgi:pilus assembly protein Flp/PilA
MLIYHEWHANCKVKGAPVSGRENQLTERTQMNTMLLKLYVKFQDLMNREEGQDLVEYALVVALIALGATASMKVLATAISTEFTTISTAFSSGVA